MTAASAARVHLGSAAVWKDHFSDYNPTYPHVQQPQSVPLSQCYDISLAHLVAEAEAEAALEEGHRYQQEQMAVGSPAPQAMPAGVALLGNQAGNNADSSNVASVNALAPLSSEELKRYGVGADVERLSEVLQDNGNGFGLDILNGKLVTPPSPAATTMLGLQRTDLSPGSSRDKRQHQLDKVALTRDLRSSTPNPMDFALDREGDSNKKEGKERQRRGSVPGIGKVALLKSQKPTMPGKGGGDIGKTQSLFEVSKQRKRRKSVS